MKNIFLLLFTLFVLPVFACSSFMLKQGNDVLFGKNYDWLVEDGMIVINKPGIKKRGIIDPHPHTWTSKYGSVTFNQYGREFPMGGMNEKGLCMEVLWLKGTKYPPLDTRKGLAELQWIQYQLDTAKDVGEVLASEGHVRVSCHSFTPVHFMVVDKAGEAATIEFLEGKMVAHRTPEMTVTTLTNETYERSLEYVKGTKLQDDEFESFERFAILAKHLPKTDANIKDAFRLLKRVCAVDTQWRIVYDPKACQIHFFTRSFPVRRTVDCKDLDYSGPVMVFPLSEKISGDVTKHFIPYTRELNRSLIDRSFEQTPFLKGLPPSFREELANYPDSTT